jgi:muramidase (phage lysozyme)
MPDIATLGLAVDSRPVSKASDDLGKFMSAAAGAERATERFTGVLPRANDNLGRFSSSSRLAVGQMQNMQFQLQDMVIGLTSGQSPFTVITQQGSQMAQSFASGTGPVAALRIFGSSLVSFLTNPLNLAVLGFGLAVTAGVKFFDAIKDGGEDTEDVLKRHKLILDDIAKQYDVVREARDRAMAVPIDTPATAQSRLQGSASESLSRLTQGFLNDPVISQIMRSRQNGDDPLMFYPELAPYSRLIDKAIEQAKQGISPIRDLSNALSSIVDPQAHQDIDDLIHQFEKLQQDIEASSASAAALNPILRGLTPPRLQWDRPPEPTGTYRGSGLGGTNLPLSQYLDRGALEVIARAEGTEGLPGSRGYNTMYGGARSLGPQNLTSMTLDEILALQSRMLSSGAGASPVGRYQINQVTLQDFMNRLHLGGNTMFDEGTQDQLANAIMASTHGDPRLFRGRWDSFRNQPDAFINNIFGHAGSGPGQAASQMQKVADAPGEANLARWTEYEKELTRNEHTWMTSIDARNKSLKDGTSTLGMTQAQAAKYAAEQQAINEAHRLGIPLVDEYARKMHEAGQAAYDAAKSQESYQDQVKRVQELRDVTQGFASDLIHGLREGKSVTDALSGSLDNLADKLLDMSLNAIFDSIFAGQPGQPTGASGLFGFLGSLFGGAPCRRLSFRRLGGQQ